METKAAIITLTHVYNYGNSLQNYAVQEILKNFGIVPETIITDFISFKDIIKKRISAPIKRAFYRLDVKEQRINSFDKFEKKHIKISPYKNVYKSNTRVNHRYSYFILGSDQVWNPSWYNNKKKNIFLLTFVDDSKKVCFSPSFGLNELPKEWIEWFSIWLTRLPEISVREESGLNIIRKISGKNATLLIDPTLMISQNVWLNIASPPKKVDCNTDYILTYFLGGISNKVHNDIKAIAEKYHLKIYNLLYEKQPELYVAGPSEFLYLIHHAKLIITDSFHGCVFSFLFRKPFLVYPRNGTGQNMMDRIYTLLNKFSLERKFVNSNLENQIFECNYKEGFDTLNNERQKVNHFLLHSMHMEY